MRRELADHTDVVGKELTDRLEGMTAADDYLNTYKKNIIKAILFMQQGHTDSDFEGSRHISHDPR